MKTYGINLLLVSNAGTTTITGHIPVAVTPEGALEGSREHADKAMKYWTTTHPDQDFEMVEVVRTTVDTWPATERRS
jgi:hypothetical protein